jgi:hypothetical protein
MKLKTSVFVTAIVFLATSAWAGQITLYTFCTQQFCTDGAYPYAGMIFDSAYNLYGTTQQGGTDLGGGTVFQLTRTSSGWTHTVLHSFLDGSDGANPVGPLVMDPAGDIYGVASGGGLGFGTVFELTPVHGGWNFQVIYTFQGVMTAWSASTPAAWCWTARAIFMERQRWAALRALVRSSS